MENAERRMLLAGLGLVGAAAAASASAGSLTPPPGPVAPTGKTTAEIEPRTPISTAPITISVPGSYYLTASLTVPAGFHAITINASDVTLDLNGFTISGPAGLTTSLAAAILVNNVHGVAVRNGSLTNMRYGINFSGGNSTTSYGHLLEDVKVAKCFSIGANFAGDSPGSVVRNCTFSQIGGSTAAANANATAINTYGGVTVLHCAIGTVTGVGVGLGIGIDGLNGSCYVGNTIMNCDYGIYYGKYQNNLTYYVGAPFSAGIDAGGNN